MNIEVVSKFNCIGKCEPNVRADGKKSFSLMVSQSNDCGRIAVNESIYNAVAVGKPFALAGIQKTFNGNTYIGWVKLID